MHHFGRQVQLHHLQAGEGKVSTQLPNVLRRILQHRALGVQPLSAPIQPVVDVRLSRQLLRLHELSVTFACMAVSCCGTATRPPCEGSYAHTSPPRRHMQAVPRVAGFSCTQV